MRRGATLIAVLLVLGTGPALAQERTGTVAGRAFDQDRAPLPGVTVTLEGPTMMGTRSEVTRDDGTFRFVLVPPGRYHLQASLSGFATAERSQLPVELGKTVEVELVMPLATFSETVSVEADAIVIDTASSRVGTNLGAEFVGTLATDRRYQSVMKMVPGVVGTDNGMFHGASGYDNVYLLDGTPTADPYTRTWSVSMNFDNLDEVQVITAGAPAEYGGGVGAVVNLVTKSGSNVFAGTLRLTYSDEDLNDSLRGDRYYFDEPDQYVTEFRPALNVSGPILRDRLWFFASWEGRDKEKAIVRYMSEADAEAGRYTNSTGSAKGHYVTGKLTFQPTNSIQWFVHAIDDPVETPNYSAYSGTQSRAPDADRTREQGGLTLISELSAVLTDASFLQLKYSLKDKDLNSVPVDREGPIYYRPINGGVYWGSAYDENLSQRDMQDFGATYSHFVSGGLGQHDLRAGLSFQRADLGSYLETYPSNEYIRLNSSGANVERRVYIQRPGWNYTIKDIWTVFAQDSWRITPRLTLNLGLRLENYRDKNNLGEAIIDWGWGDRVQPRLGAVYQVPKGKIHATAGRYYDVIGSDLTRNYSALPERVYDRYNWSAARGEWVLAQRYIEGAAYVTREEDLEPPHMDEATLGYERSLAPDLVVGATVVVRDWSDGIEDDDGTAVAGNPAADGNYHWRNIGTYRRYRGLDLMLRKALGSGKGQLSVNYTLSKTEGYTGDDDYSGAWGNNPFRYYHQWGRWPMDRTHNLKLLGSYQLPYGLVAGGSLVYWTGAPYSITGRVRTSTSGPWKGASFTDYNISERGAKRLPDLWQLDCRLEKRFGLGRFGLSVYVDVFNLTDNQEADRLDSSVGTISLAGDQPGAAYTVVDANSAFMQYNRWQAPRSYFFGLKLEL